MIPQDRNTAADLAALLGVLKCDWVAMLHGYFDESGTDHGSPFTCVAGYLFEPDQCIRFENEWSEALDEFGIKCFHMADCAHGTGEFKSLEKAQRAELAKRCIGIIKRRARVGFMASIAQEEFKALETANGIHDAYVFCLIWCVACVSSWLGRYSPNEKVSLFFEQGARLQARASLAIEWQQSQPFADKYYHSHTFIQKTSAKGIQAADLLAWEWQADLKSIFRLNNRRRRLSFRSLLEKTHLYNHMSKDHVLGVMEQRDDPALHSAHILEPDNRNIITVKRIAVSQ